MFGDAPPAVVLVIFVFMLVVLAGALQIVGVVLTAITNTPQTQRPARSQRRAAARSSGDVPARGSTPEPQRMMPLREWWPIVTQEAVHLRLIGPTKSGKTVFAMAVASEFDGQLFIIDPVWTPANWGGLRAATVAPDGDYAPIGEAIDGLIEELKQRGADLQRSLAPSFSRLTVIFDEVPDTVTELPDQAGLLVRRLALRGRHGNMHLIGLGQSERVKAWGIEGYGDAAESFATIYFGTKAIERLPWLARAAKYPAVLEWRGEVHAIDTRDLPRLAARPISADRLFNLPVRDVNDEGGELASLTEDARKLLVFLGEWDGESDPSHRQMEQAVAGYKGGAAIDRVDKALLLLQKRALLPSSSSRSTQ